MKKILDFTLGVFLFLCFCGFGTGITLAGPVLLGGDDLNDHGRRVDHLNFQGWLYIEKALINIDSNVTRTGPFTVDIAGLGVEEHSSCPFDNQPADCPPPSFLGGHAGAAIASAAANAGLVVQIFPGVSGIADFFQQLSAGTVNPRIIYLPGNQVGTILNGSRGGFSEAEELELANHALAIRDFVSSGGGLMAHGAARGNYLWLKTLLPGIEEIAEDELIPPECQSEGAFLTPLGQQVFPDLVNSDIDANAGPCHSHFAGDLGDLDILAMDGSTFVLLDGSGNSVNEIEPTENPAGATGFSIGDDAIGNLTAPVLTGTGISISEIEFNGDTASATVTSIGADFTGSLVKPVLPGSGVSITEIEFNGDPLNATTVSIGADILGSIVKPSLTGTGNTIAEIETNDDPASATAVIIGDDFSGSMTEGDLDYFAFSANGGEKLAFIIDRPTNFGLDFTILAPDGITELKSLCCNLGRHHQSTFTLPNEAGTYYILMRRTSSGGDYLFSLRETLLENPFHDHDYFAFDANGGEKLAFIIDRPTNFGLEFAILAPDGTTKLKSLCCNLGRLHQSTFTLPEIAGTYYILMRQSSSSSAGDYVFKLRETTLEDPFQDHDYFAFDANGGEKLAFILDRPSNFGLEFAIIAPDGTTKLKTLCCNLGSLHQSAFTLPNVPGTYYILLRQSSSLYGGDYLFKLRETQLEHPFQDHDYFAFDANGGEKLVFIIDRPTNFGLEFAIFAPDGTTELKSVCCNLGTLYQLDFTLPNEAGTYYILMRQSSSQYGGDYTLNLRATAPAGPFPFIIGGEAVSIIPTAPPSIDLAPDISFNPVGTSHTLTATVTGDGGVATEGATVLFNVVAGPNNGNSGTDTTDANGNATFAYTGDGGVGLDQIQAGFFDTDGTEIESDVVLKSWNDCSASPIAELSPANGASFPAGQQIIIYGQWLDRNGSDLGTPAILINGMPADSTDASGRFFKTVVPGPGENIFHVDVADACGHFQTVLTLNGLLLDPDSTDSMSDITASLRDEYRDTTFNRANNWLVVDALARNAGFAAIDGPVLMAIGPQLDPAVDPINRHGNTTVGEPYFGMVREDVRLLPDEAGEAVNLLFHNPERVPVDYDVRWLAYGNHAPQFSSVPLTRAVPELTYAYDADVHDPDGDPIVFKFERAPVSMAIDNQTGQVTWVPQPADAGLHEVTIHAQDNRGGSARQSFTISVGEPQPNRSPVFTSAPITQADTGADYVYDANAVDFDGDAVTFSLVDGPPGMVIHPSSGLVEWNQAVAGQHPVGLQATDAMGGLALQTFVLYIGELSTNQSIPQISGLPDPFAVVDARYLYQPLAIDADGDPLTFSLLASPEGMTINTATGLVQWQPDTTQLGGPHPVSISVSDGKGGVAGQSFSVTVVAVALHPPVFQDPPPPLFALAGQTYAYQALAIDPDAGPVSYALLLAPAGMLIDANSGLLSWLPAAGDVGLHQVVIEATDASGDKARLGYQLTVRAGNSAPQIVSSPGQNVVAGETYRYLVLANDADGDTLSYGLDQGPAGMAIDPVTGLITWTASVALIGTHPVTVTVRDCCDGLDQQTYNLTVEADIIPPGGVISFSQEPAPLGEIIRVLVSVSDNVGIQSVGLTAACNGEPAESLLLDGDHTTAFTASALGTCTFQATVTDLSQNETIVNRDLQVGSQGHVDDPYPPTCNILSPAVESVITNPVQMTASVSDLTASGDPGSGPFNWTVRIARFGTSDFRTIGSGTGTDIMAQLDPTSLPNDTYQVECSVDDGVQTQTIDFRYHVAGDLKLGNFSVTFVDLTIPVTGIPMVIAREYNSLDTTLHEFGAGWRLKLAGQVTDSAREDPLEGFSAVSRVFVTRPDGRRVSFDFAPVSLGFPWPSVFLPKFSAEPGEYGTLTVADAALFQQVNGQFYNITGPFNPTTYVYTTREGVAYTLDEVDGLQSVEDLNGNTLQVTEQGLISSSGLSLLFKRNESGQITRVIEPEVPGDPAPPAELNYEYDGLGNLTAVVDQLGGRTTFRYDDPNFRHYMTGLENPLGQALIRNIYDNEGLLIAICDANGDIVSLDGCARFDPDASTRSETTYNARGFREDFIYDDRGNLLIERNFMQNGDILDTVRSYDADNNVLSKTDPEGNTASFSYDGQGNLLTVTDPSGVRTLTLTYNALNLPETKCDELDNCTLYTYDEMRNLRFMEDSLGGVSEFRYNSLGQLEARIDAEGNTWQFDYDAFGFLTSTIDPLGNSTLLLYRPSGDLEAVIDRNGREIVYEYDDAHRLLSETWDTSPATVYTYNYNVAGQMTSTVTPDSVMAFEYTNTGLLERIDNAGTPGAPAVVMNYTFDENQNVTRVSDSLGGETTYEYDELDRMISVRQAGTGVNEKRVDWVDDNAGLIRELRRYRNITGTLPVTHTFFDYECRGCPHRMSAIEHRKATDNSTVHDIQIDRDPVGNILQLVDAEGTHDYGYDDAYRLSSADHPAGGVQADEFYTYDLVGNRLSAHRSASYNYSYQLGAGGNQLSQDDHFDYDYDNNGNLIRKTDRSTGLITAYTYDHRDRLVSVVDFALNGDPVTQLAYKYDAADRRILVDDNGTLSHFIYDATNPVLKLDDSGSVRVRRMYSRQTDGILADEVLGQTRWFLTDQVGNIRDLIDNDSQLISHYTYDSFGVTLEESASAQENDLFFNSREFNQDSGIGFYRSRSYSPELGRFLQEDPLTPFNYSFVDNNPLIFNDPTGEVAALEYGLMLYCKATNLAGQLENAAIERIYKVGFGNIISGLSGGPVDDPETIIKELVIGVNELWVQLFNSASGGLQLKVSKSGAIGIDVVGSLKSTVCTFN